MRKINPLLFIPTLCLASCSSVGYAGTYSFQMGKEGSTNIRLALTLTDERVVNQEKGIDAKKFTVDANLPNLSIEDLAASLGIDVDIKKEDLAELISAVFEVLKDCTTLYYNVGTLVRPQGTQLKLGCLFDTEETGIDIPSEVVESIVCAYINDTSVTLQVPVSLDDLQLQLCWYGLYINFDSSSFENIIVALDEEDLPGIHGEERFGTHPVVTKDKDKKVTYSEVDEMNIKFAKEFSNTPVYESASSSKVIGNIAKMPDNHMYFYKNSETVITGANLSGAVNEKNYYGIFDEKKDVNFVIDTSDGTSGKSFKIIEIKESGSSEILDEDKYLQEPFVFRDFHDIRIGLARE